VINLNLDNEYIFEGNFGLERETLRVTSDGKLSQTPHPFEDKLLDRDFCENQLEMITPVCRSIDELFESLEKLDTVAREEIKKIDEYLWMYSNPPYFGAEEDIPIARFGEDMAAKQEYRENLERRYGKRIMLYSGIHYNFSFSDRLLKSFSGSEDFDDFKNKLYFRMAKQVSRYSWLPVLLTSASSVYDVSLDGDYNGGDGFDGSGSRRNSTKGYWNQFLPIFDYTNLQTYIDGVRECVTDGRLLSEKELYMPVRLKSKGEYSLESLEKYGVNHIELRMFDVNPLSKLGIFKADAEFIHYFLIYLLSLPDFEFTSELQAAAIKNHQAAAMYDLSEMKINGYNAVDAAVGMLDDMAVFFASCDKVLSNIKKQKEKITQNKRYCVEIYEKYHEDYNKKMFETIKNGF